MAFIFPTPQVVPNMIKAARNKSAAVFPLK